MKSHAIQLAMSDHAKVGIASVLVQGATLVLLLGAKTGAAPEEFADFLTQMAVAAIVGSFASFKLEVLLYQRDESVSISQLAIPTLLILATVTSVGALGAVAGAVWNGGSVVAAPTLPLAAAFALQELQQFVLVQEARWRRLIQDRGIQALGLVLVSIWAAVVRDPQSATLLWLYAAALLSTPCIWLVGRLLEASRNAPTSRLEWPDRTIVGRGISLTVSVFASTAYLMVPIVIAGATQTAEFAADFGFLLKSLAAPITLIGRVLGQVFLARSLHIQRSDPAGLQMLRDETLRTMTRSLIAYTATAGVVLLAVLFLRSALSIENTIAIIPIAIAAMAQSTVNPIAWLRVILHQESTFASFDVLRLCALSAALLLTPDDLFAATFGVVSVVLYVTYARMLFRRMAH